MALDMNVVHNLILRTINAIYLQCVNVSTRGSEQDVKEFVTFSREWASSLDEHHRTEETTIFPQIEEMTGQPGLMAANVDQHAAFHDGLARFDEYLKGVQEGAEKFDGQKLRSVIDSFMGELRKHLSDEIVTLLALSQYKDVDWATWFSKTLDDIIQKTNGPAMRVRLEANAQDQLWIERQIMIKS